MRIYTEAGYTDSAALFFEVSDELLEKIRSDINYCLDIENVVKLFNAKGDNAHIFRLLNVNGADINEHLATLLKDYKTVSWWNRDNEFIIKRR